MKRTRRSGRKLRGVVLLAAALMPLACAERPRLRVRPGLPPDSARGSDPIKPAPELPR
jgi:hypothetical protein